MTSLERSDVVSSLTAKGFVGEPTTHHERYRLRVGQKKTEIYTYVSRGSKYKTLSPQLVSKMAQQAKLTKGQFVDLVKCPLDRAGYLRLLVASGALHEDEVAAEQTVGPQKKP